MNYNKSEAKAAARDSFRGVWAAITTPFNGSNFDLDEGALRATVHHMTENLHVDGIFCTGVMGEFWALTKEERKRVVEIVCEEAQGRCKVIAHTGHHSAHETIDLTRHAETVGADFAILMSPYYPAATEDCVLDWFRYVAERVEIGIWMFDTGYSNRPELSPATIAKIAELPNICGAKLARSTAHYAEVRSLVGDEIVLSSPSESNFLMMIREHGQRVHQSSAAPYLLQTRGSLPIRDYAELALAGKFDEAEKISDRLIPARAVAHEWIMEPFLKYNLLQIGAIKTWAGLLGMPGGPVRPPLPQFTAQQAMQLKAALAKVGLLESVPA